MLCDNAMSTVEEAKIIEWTFPPIAAAAIALPLDKVFLNAAPGKCVALMARIQETFATTLQQDEVSVGHQLRELAPSAARDDRENPATGGSM
jgi:hypothetical protein